MNKLLVQVCVLSIASLYFVLASIFKLPYATVFIGLLVLVATFIGFWVIIHNTKYDGSMIVETTEEGKKVFSLQLEGDPADFEDKDTIIFQVISSVK